MKLNPNTAHEALDTARMGARGAVVIPTAIRRRLGLSKGSLLIIEVDDHGVHLRPALAVPVEKYTTERRAEFLLNNAVDAAEYRRALATVRSLGLDPDRIPHDPPTRAKH